MTAEEVFYNLDDKYGEDFNWHMLPFTDRTYVPELKREIGSEHFLFHKQIWAVAKCDWNDDVLYVTSDEDKRDVYYIFHLTWSECNEAGYPRYIKLGGIEQVQKYLEEMMTV